MEYNLSKHAVTTIGERAIPLDCVDICLSEPDQIERRLDGTVHYCKRFEKLGGRWLRVVVNDCSFPPLLVTAFFDRRLRRSNDD